MGRQAVVHATGHPNIRATHAKTLEVTAEPTITARATCVVGVAAALDPVALGLLRGPVRITVAAGGRSASGDAVVHPSHEVSDRIVVRRSASGDADTLAVGSTLVAADLDRALVAALARPGAVVTLTVAERGPRRPLVLLGTPAAAPPTGRLGLLWRHADGVLDEGGIVAATAPTAAWLAEAARRGARFASLDGSAGPTPALLAAGLPATPALWLGRVGRREARRPEIAGLLAAPPVPAVLTVPVADAESVLGHSAAAVEDDPLDVGIAVTWTDNAAAAVEAFPGEAATVVLPARGDAAERVDLGAVVRALSAPRTLSEALGPLGATRRRVYDVLARPESA